jgi:biotin-(acetyl-CoA carboxylase) ligase
LARHSSAVNEWTTQPISRADILVALLNAFDRVYQQLQHDPTAYQAHWRQLVPIVGTSVTINRHDTQISGTVTQLNDDGSIIVATATGNQIVHSGIIQFD